jgi:nitrite reductase/ring-hydroxylating ferredoxin subunit
MNGSNWVRAASTQEVDEAGGLLGRYIGGTAVALYRADGAYYATLDQCTHGQARLSDGYLEGTIIECPLHQGLFDVRSGEVKGPPCTKPLTTLAVRREGEDLFIDLGA